MMMTLFLKTAHTCSPEYGKEFPSYTMEQTLEMAPTVVVGKDMFHDSGYNTVRMDVYCVLKHQHGAAPVPSRIQLLQAAVRIDCQGTQLTVNTTYIITLSAGPTPDQFDIYEPGLMDTGAFLFNNDSFATATTVCGVGENVTYQSSSDSPICSGIVHDANKCTIPMGPTSSRIVVAPVLLVLFTLMQLINYLKV